MTLNQTRTIIIALAIAFTGIVGITWYIGTINTGNILQSGETSLSTIEFHSLHPGTHIVSDIRIETPVQKVPEKMMVYSKQLMSENEIIQIASDLGLSGEPVNESGWISLRDGSRIFTSQPQGRVISYIDEASMPSYELEFIDSHLPSDDKAKMIADEFLFTHNIFAEGMKFIGINHDIGYYMGKEVMVKNDETINIMYNHFIDGYEIFNEKLRVRVTFIGTVDSIFWKWTRYTPYKEYPLMNPQEAVDNLQKTGIVVLDDIQNPEKAVVRNITIGYLGETRSKDIDYLIPVYKIEGIVYGNGMTAEFFQYIPASPKAAAELI